MCERKKKGTRNDAGERHDERHEDPEDPLRGQLRPDRGEGRDRRIIYSMQITQAGWRRKREAPCRVHGIFFFSDGLLDLRQYASPLLSKFLPLFCPCLFRGSVLASFSQPGGGGGVRQAAWRVGHPSLV